MEKARSKRVKQTVDIDEDVPTAPTMEDFYYDPGIKDQGKVFTDPLGVAQLELNVPKNDNEICDNLQGLSVDQSGQFSPQPKLVQMLTFL